MGLFDGLFKKKKQNNDQYYLVFNKGKEYHDSGDFKKAIKYYSQAISINPNLPEAYANRAALYGGDTNCRNYQESTIQHITRMTLKYSFYFIFNTSSVRKEPRGS